MTREREMLNEILGGALDGPKFSQMSDEEIRECRAKMDEFYEESVAELTDKERALINELFGDVLNGPTFSQMTDGQMREYMAESAMLAEVGLTDEEKALLRI